MPWLWLLCQRNVLNILVIMELGSAAEGHSVSAEEKPGCHITPLNPGSPGTADG